MKYAMIALASTAMIFSQANAQQAEVPEQTVFEVVDLNNDGYASFSEIVSFDSEATAASIMRFDPNFDQRLTEAQFEDYLEASPLPRAALQQGGRFERPQAQRPASIPSRPSGGYGS